MPSGPKRRRLRPRTRPCRWYPVSGTGANHISMLIAIPTRANTSAKARIKHASHKSWTRTAIALSHALDIGRRLTNMHACLFNALRVLMLTGCHASEILELEIDKVVLMHKVIHLKDSKTGALDVKLSDALILYLQTALTEVAGHSRITTTEGYTHIMDSSTYRASNNVANAICG